MNKSISLIVIAFISFYFQGCCSDCQKQMRMNKELGEMAYSYVHSPQLDRLLKDLVQKAIEGGDYDIDKYIYVRNLIHNEYDRELFEDYDVELLKGLGDVRFLKALKRQDGDSQDDICGSLMRYQWNVDGWKEQYDAAKVQPELEYPKTKEYVFELSKSWYRNN